MEESGKAEWRKLRKIAFHYFPYIWSYGKYVAVLPAVPALCTALTLQRLWWETGG